MTSQERTGRRETGGTSSKIADVLGWPVELVRRGSVTLAAVGGVALLAAIPAPEMSFRQGALYGIPSRPVAVGELGLIPFAVGFVLVEWVARVWPGETGARSFGADRSTGTRWGAVLTGLVLAAVQAGSVAWYWLQIVPAGYGGAIPGLEAGDAALITAGISLFAGSCLYALAALWVRERGIGDGFAVVLGAGLAANVSPAAEKFGDWLSGMNMYNLDVFGVLGNVLAVSVVILGTVWAVTRFEGWVTPGESGGDRVPNRSASTPYHVPPAGIVPFALGSSILWSLWSVLSLSGEGYSQWFLKGLEAASYGGSFWYFLQELGLVSVLGWVGMWGAGRSDETSVQGVGDEQRSTQRRARFASLGLLAGLVFFDVYGGPLLRSFGVVSLVLGTAIAVDLAREWRFRSAFPDAGRVASLHRTGAVGPTLEALGRRDVPALARARCFRGLLRTFGAFTPVEIYVPEASRDLAREALSDAGIDP